MVTKEKEMISLSWNRLKEAVKYRKTSLRKLGEVREIDRSEKTIRRCKNGHVDKITIR